MTPMRAANCGQIATVHGAIRVCLPAWDGYFPATIAAIAAN